MSLGASVALTAAAVRLSQTSLLLPVLPPQPLVHYIDRPDFVNGAVRPLFRHSIVPGGVYSAEEVQAAILRDPVVAAHYAKLDQSRIVGAVLDAPRAVYVSYRIGQRTMWTASKIVLPAGERLLTDGTRAVRARCGNLVSETGGEQGVAGASGERLDPAELDQQLLPALIARGPDTVAAAPVEGLPSGPFFDPVPGALPLLLGGEPTTETPFEPFGPQPPLFGPTTTTGVVLQPPTTTTTGTVPPATTTGVVVPPTTTTTGTVPPTTTTTTGTVPPTTTTTGVIVPPTTTLTSTTAIPTMTTFSQTSGTIPEPSRLALLVLAWVAFRYRRAPR